MGKPAVTFSPGLSYCPRISTCASRGVGISSITITVGIVASYAARSPFAFASARSASVTSPAYRSRKYPTSSFRCFSSRSATGVFNTATIFAGVPVSCGFFASVTDNRNRPN